MDDRRTTRLTRRDLLKLAVAAPLAAGACAHPPDKADAGPRPAANVLVLVHDAMSARHLSLYGYRHPTTPNFERFAGRALVYRNHYSAGTYTSPGTASLLTGTVPWTHRAMVRDSLVRRDRTGLNLFRLMGPGFHQVTFSQNPWASHLLDQFAAGIDLQTPRVRFNLAGRSSKMDGWTGDPLGSDRGFTLLFNRHDRPASLFLSLAEHALFRLTRHRLDAAWQELYPYGLPGMEYNVRLFRLEELTDVLAEMIAGLPQPFLAYVHLWAPHEPYCPRRDFIGAFDGNRPPKPKPGHPLSGPEPAENLARQRRRYDEFVATVDFEFGRLTTALERVGLLDNSHVVVTSDHGELFERGVLGHVTPLMCEGLIRIPLLVSTPDRKTGAIDAFTSSVDILPTLLHLAGRPVPEACEGRLLPELGGGAAADRPVFIFDAKDDSVFRPARRATGAVLRDGFKLVHFRGYPGCDGRRELYDLRQDPEELEDLAGVRPALADDLEQVLLRAWRSAEQPFES